MSMLTAGMTHGMLQHFDIPTNVSAIQGLGKHAANQSVHAAVKIGSDLATTGRVDGKGVALSSIAGTIGGILSNKIGTWYRGSEGAFADAVLHKVLHTMNGTLGGAIVGGEKGMTAGALGTLVSSIASDMITPTGGLDHDPSMQPSPERVQATKAVAQVLAAAIPFAAGMSAEQIGIAHMMAQTELNHNFGFTALHHAGANVDVKDEIIDEDTLRADAETNGISKEEQALVRAKLQSLSNETLGTAPKAIDLITEIPSSPEELQATQKSLLKGYVQKIALANQNLHQILAEHPWAEKAITSGMQMFSNCVRAMLYIDMAILGGTGGAALCASAGVKSIAGLRTCALLTGASTVAATALVLEPSIENLLSQGIQELGKISAEAFGDTAHEKAAIQQLVGDAGNVAGLVAGGKYLQYRGAHLPSFSGVAGEVEINGASNNSQKGILPKPEDRPLESPYYSTSFRAVLKEGEHYPGLGDAIHFKEANKQLYNALQKDAGYALQMETLYPGITEAVAPGLRGAFPGTSPSDVGLTWHHNVYEPGVLELIPTIHHEAGGIVQQNLHPGNKGGMHSWGGGRKKK